MGTRIAVGKLQVLAYVPIANPERGSYHLEPLSVTECAYYKAVKQKNRRVYVDYNALILKRDPTRNLPSWEEFWEQVEGISADRGFIEAKAASAPIRIFKGTLWLEDGHHRAAIICALFGTEAEVVVELSKSPLPKDVGRPTRDERLWTGANS